MIQYFFKKCMELLQIESIKLQKNLKYLEAKIS